jgi:hypothetical protein
MIFHCVIFSYIHHFINSSTILAWNFVQVYDECNSYNENQNSIPMVNNIWSFNSQDRYQFSYIIDMHEYYGKLALNI